MDRSDPVDVLGVITAADLLEAHLRDLVNERKRERILLLPGLVASNPRSRPRTPDLIVVDTSTPPAGDGARPLTIAELDQWTLFGGTWRAVQIGERHATVELCSCTNEAVDRRETNDPDVIARLLTAE